MVPRPVDAMRQGMPAHLLHLAQSGAASELSTERVTEVTRMESSDGAENDLTSDDKREAPKEDATQQGLDYETRQQVVALARMRGLHQFALSDEGFYRLHLNPDTGMVELIEVLDAAGERVLMVLTPDELKHLAAETHRTAGLLEDTAG